MSNVIQLLPDHVANQIAAGEVVQRPASVIKELLENSIDAKASRIQVIIKDAGKTLVQVIDDGMGMNITDARMSFERHATSKIKLADDLFSLKTKGFRGEALASIAAIAHVELKTKTDEDEVGTCIKVEGSEVVSQDACVTPVGTSISVKNLFYNIPARRNFLKSDNVETRHIIDEFQRVAFAHPDISFSLMHNGNELFQLPIANFRQRITNILGGKTNEKLVPVEEDTEIVKVSGFVGKPEFAKKSRGEQFFFVNNRFIKSPYLNHAVVASFEGLLKEKSYPSYFLYLEVDPKSIDINIHPTKTEIKFDDEHALYAILKSSIKHSLGQFNVAPMLDFERDSELDTPYDYKNKDADVPQVEVDRNFNPFQTENNFKAQYAGGGNYRKEKPAEWESLYSGMQSETETDVDIKQIEFESEEVTGNLFGAQEEQTEKSTFQLQKKYIVSTLKSGILVIDQHRAHT
ncbi:MAG: DNA mismatch repair endonuclease MutL, partial [Christiangramia sp.]